MSFRPMLRPGQGDRCFTVLRREGGKSEKGRPTTSSLKLQGQLFGMITQAKQKDIEQWKQNGHPITHTIVQRGTVNQAKATDILELAGTDRRFLVQGIRDPGDLGLFTVYHVEERFDLNGR